MWNPFYKKRQDIIRKSSDIDLQGCFYTPGACHTKRNFVSWAWSLEERRKGVDRLDWYFQNGKGLRLWLISHSFSQTRGSNNLISQLEAGLELLSLQYQTTVLSESSTAGTVCLKIILVYHQWIVSKIVLRKEKAIRWTCSKTQSASPKLGCTSMEEKEWVALAYKKDTECLSTCNRTW